MRAENLHAIVLLALVGGLALSALAAYETVHPALQRACSVSPFFSCAKVAQSGHSSTLGVPDWAIGVGGYLLLLGLDVPLYLTWRRDLLLGVTALSTLGVAISAYFAYVELALIGAVCLVCLSAYLGNLVALGALLALVRQGRAERTESIPEAVVPDPGESGTSR